MHTHTCTCTHNTNAHTQTQMHTHTTPFVCMHLSNTTHVYTQPCLIPLLCHIKSEGFEMLQSLIPQHTHTHTLMHLHISHTCTHTHTLDAPPHLHTCTYTHTRCISRSPHTLTHSHTHTLDVSFHISTHPHTYTPTYGTNLVERGNPWGQCWYGRPHRPEVQQMQLHLREMGHYLCMQTNGDVGGKYEMCISMCLCVCVCVCVCVLLYVDWMRMPTQKLQYL